MKNIVGQIIASAVLIIGVVMLAAVLLHAGKEQGLQMQQDYRNSQALYNKGDYPGAEDAIRAWIDTPHAGTNSAPGDYQLGRCLLQNGRPDQALQEFQEAQKDANGYYGGRRGNTWIPPVPDLENKAQSAIKWIQQNPNWQPGQGQLPIPQGPPRVD